MESYTKRRKKRKPLYVGVDLHQRSWHVTVRIDEQELFSGGIPAQWEALRMLLARYPSYEIDVVYEAGYFGFWLYDGNQFLHDCHADLNESPPWRSPPYGRNMKSLGG